MKNNLKEVSVASSLILLSVLLVNPFHLWMPDIFIMCVLFVVLILFVLFASFILREKIVDERDDQHRTLAGRNAFLAGSAVLIIAIVVQEYMESLDPWLVFILVVMLLTKIGTRMWSDRNL